jgi:pilin isopeptide linkage protein
LTGKTLETDMFSFVVTGRNGSVAATGTNAVNGTINFGAIGFNKAGTYAYTVSEITGKASGITYDGTKYLVKVEVTDDGAGNLKTAVTYPKGGIVFHNTYKVTTTSSLTGDSAQLVLLWTLCSLSFCGLVGLAINRKIRRRKRNR